MSIDADSGKVSEKSFDFNNGIFNKLYGRAFSGSIGKADGDGGMKVFAADGKTNAYFLRGVKYTYEYDTKGLILLQTQTRNSTVEIVTRYRYVFDNHGNWTEKHGLRRYPNTENIDPNRWFATETEHRIIEYYE